MRVHDTKRCITSWPKPSGRMRQYLTVSRSEWVVPHMEVGRGAFWIIDDTGFPK